MASMELWKKLSKRYFIDAMGAMAFGLFASLLIGTIFNALGMIPGLSVLGLIGKDAAKVAGPAMAVSIAVSLKAAPLVVYSSALVGWLANSYGGAGGPLAVLVITVIACEVGMLVSKKTKVDILVTPFVTILVGGLISIWCAPFIGKAVGVVSAGISFAMTCQPFVMGILVSALVGIALTLPISSAAICAALGLSGYRLGRRRTCARGRRGGCGLLCANGRLRRYEFPRKPLGRACFAGNRNQYAPDAQHCAQSAHLDSPHAGVHDYRSYGKLPVPDADVRRGNQLGNGHMRDARTCRHHPRLA